MDGNGWDYYSDYGSFPHSLRETQPIRLRFDFTWEGPGSHRVDAFSMCWQKPVPVWVTLGEQTIEQDEISKYHKSFKEQAQGIGWGLGVLLMAAQIYMASHRGTQPFLGDFDDLSEFWACCLPRASCPKLKDTCLPSLCGSETLFIAWMIYPFLDDILQILHGFLYPLNVKKHGSNLWVGGPVLSERRERICGGNM